MKDNLTFLSLLVVTKTDFLITAKDKLDPKQRNTTFLETFSRDTWCRILVHNVSCKLEAFVSISADLLRRKEGDQFTESRRTDKEKSPVALFEYLCLQPDHM